MSNDDVAVDLFPGFDARWIDIAAGRFFARVGGAEAAPPLLLLHGFPQSHAMWHRIAPALAKTHRVVCLDLKGYGWSAAPKGDGGRAAYSKRVMGGEAIAVMETLGHVRFALAGHDRGARVAYRLALDEPGRVKRLAILDVVPTFVQWERMATSGEVAPHWRDLARPAPEPETAMARDPVGYHEGLMRRWTGSGDLAAFDPAALDLYRDAWRVPERNHAMCEDYRAGSETGPDVAQEREDLAGGKTLACPVLVAASTDYLDVHADEPALAVWRRTFAPHAVGGEIRCGHFVAEENAGGTLAVLQPFLAA